MKLTYNLPLSMKYIHDTLDTHGKPKFICRVQRGGKLIFYKAFYYTDDDKPLQKINAHLAVKKFIESLGETYSIIKTVGDRCFDENMIIPTRKYSTGVYKYCGSIRSHASYVGSIHVRGDRTELRYSTQYYGEELSYDLAVRSAKALRLFFKIPIEKCTKRHYNKLKSYIKFKNSNGRCKLQPTKEQAVKRIVKRFEEFEKYCNALNGNP